MTNEEKASEIANTYGSEVLQAGAYFGAEKMAKWKDQQHSEIIKEECNASYESGYAEGKRKTEARFREKLEQMMKVAYFDKEVYKHIITELFEEAK